jgi:formylglycine-generating enzyme required for sulfatase activity
MPSVPSWEYAARGTAARAYPWGNSDPPETLTLANWITDAPINVGSLPDGATPEGVLDMTGNLWEWVEDVYCDSYDTATRTCLSTHVARGGAWSTEIIDYLRAWARDSDAEGDARYGVRCAFTP